jgi:hypothetical protein
MRIVDLALFADIVAWRAAALEARLERERDRIRQAAVKREARRALAPAIVERLVGVGVLSATHVRAERREVGELAASLAAIRELQAWTEARLSEAHADAGLMPPAAEEPEPFGPPRAV